MQFDDGVYKLDRVTGELVMVQPAHVDYPVEVNVSLADRDGSELLVSIELSGMPADTQVFYQGGLLGVSDTNGKLMLDYNGPDGWSGGNLWVKMRWMLRLQALPSAFQAKMPAKLNW
ncbi:hypothetical protein HND97_10550 [Vibrio cholerae]|nr:hypothetical protein HND97_10550 [Vibrio cholerae]